MVPHGQGGFPAARLMRMAGTPPQARPGSAAPRVVALIPAYNEEAVIGEVVAGTLGQIANVIVVDDGSTDATANLARAAGAEVVSLPGNRGKAGAVMAGFAAALARGYRVVVMLDADGQHLPAEVPRVLAPVLSGEADMVVGSRFLEVKSEIPCYRVLGQKTLNLFTALGAGVSLTDTQSGFRALGPAALARLDFVSGGYSLESDMIAHFANCGLRITEVPISCRYDVPNSHKKNPALHGFEIVRAMSYAIVVRQRRVRGLVDVPLLVTGSLFGLVAVVGATLMAGPWRLASRDDTTRAARPGQSRDEDPSAGGFAETGSDWRTTSRAKSTADVRDFGSLTESEYPDSQRRQNLWQNL